MRRFSQWPWEAKALPFFVAIIALLFWLTIHDGANWRSSEMKAFTDRCRKGGMTLFDPGAFSDYECKMPDGTIKAMPDGAPS